MDCEINYARNIDCYLNNKKLLELWKYDLSHSPSRFIQGKLLDKHFCVRTNSHVYTFVSRFA